jgi:hypothetical protein
MSIPDTPATRKLLAGGTATVTGLDTPKRKAGKVELVESSYTAPATWTIPLETRGEANQREWRAKNRRAGAAWKAVREAVELWQLEPWENAMIDYGEPIYARLTRLTPKTLDSLVNLPSALKGVEDALCYLLGIDDSSPLWKPSCNQEVNLRYGVRIELSTEPFT